MNKGRLEAFSDGVLAIIITIMVLEMKAPHEAEFSALKEILPKFISYVISFIYIGIYWNNHHHMLQTTKHVTGSILWANLHLLFWLSLVPFVTAWAGENYFAPAPMALYGVVLFFAAISYTILQSTIVKEHGEHSLLAEAVGKDLKGKISLACYIAAIPSAFLSPWISGALYVLVALIWLIPDKRIEKRFAPKKIKMSYEVSVKQTGRGGTIFYREPDAELAFDWEFSMTGATVFVPAPAQWNDSCKSEKFANRRSEILENLGAELCRQQTSNGTFEIYDQWLEIIF